MDIQKEVMEIFNTLFEKECLYDDLAGKNLLSENGINLSVIELTLFFLEIEKIMKIKFTNNFILSGSAAYINAICDYLVDYNCSVNPT